MTATETAPETEPTAVAPAAAPATEPPPTHTCQICRHQTVETIGGNWRRTCRFCFNARVSAAGAAVRRALSEMTVSQHCTFGTVTIVANVDDQSIAVLHDLGMKSLTTQYMQGGDLIKQTVDDLAPPKPSPPPLADIGGAAMTFQRRFMNLNTEPQFTAADLARRAGRCEARQWADEPIAAVRAAIGEFERRVTGHPSADRARAEARVDLAEAYLKRLAAFRGSLDQPPPPAAPVVRQHNPYRF